MVNAVAPVAKPPPTLVTRQCETCIGSFEVAELSRCEFPYVTVWHVTVRIVDGSVGVTGALG
jgi:hypothetical protein